MSNTDETTKLIESNSSSSSSPLSTLSEQAMGYSSLSTFLIFIFPASGGLLFGYDIGATSASIVQIQSKSYSGVLWWEVIKRSSAMQGLLTSIGMLGAVIGCMVCFRIADRIGRRLTIITAACLYCLGSITEFASGDPTWDMDIGLTVLLVGRLVYGLGCGFAMQGAPSYIGEMAPSEIRGLLISMKEVFIVLGMLLGYSIGYAFSSVVGGWRYTYGLASIYSIVMLLGMIMLPESCRWLALNHRIDDAIASLRFVTPHPTKNDLLSLKEVANRSSLALHTDQGQSSSSTTTTTTWAEDYEQLSSRTAIPALTAGVGLVFFQQITGQPSVLYYANTIFQDIGVSSVAAIAISMFKLVATLLTTFTVDKYGRKLLLYVGCSLMLGSLIALAAAFIFPYSSSEQCNQYTTQALCPSMCAWNSEGSSSCSAIAITPQKIIIIMSLFIYIGGYQVGFGPISWLIVSEIFPLQIRSKAVSIAVVTNFLLNFLVSLLFPIELHNLGPCLTFLIYAAILIWSLYFIRRYVPETKGLSLEAIEAYFKSITATSTDGGDDQLLSSSQHAHLSIDRGMDANDGDREAMIQHKQQKKRSTPASTNGYVQYHNQVGDDDDDDDDDDDIDPMDDLEAKEAESYTYFNTTQSAVRSRSTSLSTNITLSDEAKNLLSIL